MRFSIQPFGPPRETLRKGSFSLKRTSNFFSRAYDTPFLMKIGKNSAAQSTDPPDFHV